MRNPSNCRLHLIPDQVHKQKHLAHDPDEQAVLKVPHKTSQLCDTAAQNLYPGPCENVWVQIDFLTQSASKIIIS